MQLKEFLIQQKIRLLDLEKRAKKGAAVAIFNQILVIESILNFLATEQSEGDMAKLQLSLAKQATPVDDIKPRQETQELTDGILEYAEKLQNEYASLKKKHPIKYPIDNIPEGMKIKTITSKVYGLRAHGKLPKGIVPVVRSIRDKATNKKIGEELYLVYKGE